MHCARWALWLAVAVTAACSSVEDTDPPAELVPIDNRISFRTLWQAQLGSGFDEQRVRLDPAISSGRIYVAERGGRIGAFALDTGKRVWRVDTELPISGAVGVGGGLVLVGTDTALVVALAEEDGAERWRATVSSEVLSVPRIDEGIVIVQTVDGKVFGFAADDGRTLWSAEETEPVLTLRGTSSPVVVGGAVFAGFANGRLVALAQSDGRRLWETAVAQSRGRSELERIVDIDADPLLEGRYLYVASFQGRVAQVAPETGVVLWGRELSVHAGMGVGMRRLYVTDERSHVWALGLETGGTLWKQDSLTARKLTAPTPIGAYVVVGDFEGYLHVLSADDGSILAREQFDDDGISARAQVSGDVLYVYTNSGRLHAIRLVARDQNGA